MIWWFVTGWNLMIDNELNDVIHRNMNEVMMIQFCMKRNYTIVSLYHCIVPYSFFWSHWLQCDLSWILFRTMGHFISSILIKNVQMNVRMRKMQWAVYKKEWCIDVLMYWCDGVHWSLEYVFIWILIIECYDVLTHGFIIIG